MIIVSNSGPIISFARAGYLDLLREVLQEIKIPPEAYEEIVVRGTGKPGASEVKSENWIKKEIIKDRFKVDQLPSSLELGEREAIVLAQELGSLLLIDDRLARKEAGKRGRGLFWQLKSSKGSERQRINQRDKTNRR